MTDADFENVGENSPRVAAMTDLELARAIKDAVDIQRVDAQLELLEMATSRPGFVIRATFGPPPPWLVENRVGDPAVLPPDWD